MWGKHKQAEPKLECSLVKGLDIFIEAEARQKIQILMEEYSYQEWLAYLQGKISEKGNIFVEDISIPPHKYAYGASAEAEPFNVPENCVGIIHSHHTMGAFHSATDQDYVDKNYPVSITVARNGSNNLTYDAVSYGETPCGKYIETKATVKYVQPPPLFDRDKWLKEAKANIDKSKEVTLGKYLGGYTLGIEPPYIPIRYRMDGAEGLPYVTSRGRVLTQKEYQDMVFNSEEVD